MRRNKQIEGVGGASASGVCVFAEGTIIESFNQVMKRKMERERKLTRQSNFDQKPAPWHFER
jgi:hypothetical protein